MRKKVSITLLILLAAIATVCLKKVEASIIPPDNIHLPHRDEIVELLTAAEYNCDFIYDVSYKEITRTGEGSFIKHIKGKGRFNKKGIEILEEDNLHEDKKNKKTNEYPLEYSLKYPIMSKQEKVNLLSKAYIKINDITEIIPLTIGGYEIKTDNPKTDMDFNYTIITKDRDFDKGNIEMYGEWAENRQESGYKKYKIYIKFVERIDI